MDKLPLSKDMPIMQLDNDLFADSLDLQDNQDNYDETIDPDLMEEFINQANESD